MRSRLFSALLIASGIAVAVALALSATAGPSGFRAAAIFDSAKGLLPGQLVKVAGARVGRITAVKLEPGPKALVEFSIDRRFAPFHTDARCQILPEGLISENYVQCNPGTPSAPRLARSPLDGVPTVPLADTTVPVSLQDVLNIFSLPVSERLGVLINELGIGTAARGSDIAAILNRTNPALTQGDRVLAVLDAQNTQIARAVGQTRAVMGALAARNASVRAFVDRAGSVASVAAAHSAALSEGVRRLPALLTQLDSGLAPIDRVAVRSTPLLADLRAAAPGLTELTSTLPAFVVPGLPAVRALAAASSRGTRALRAARPVVGQLSRLAALARSVLPPLDRFLVSSRDSGAFEGMLRLLYSLSTDSGAYDAISHYVTALIVPFPTCMANAAARGCGHAYDAPDQGAIPINDPGAGQQAGAGRARHHSGGTGSRSTKPRAGSTALGAAHPTAHAGRTAARAGRRAGPLPTSPGVPSSLAPLLDYLLR